MMADISLTHLWLISCPRKCCSYQKCPLSEIHVWMLQTFCFSRWKPVRASVWGYWGYIWHIERTLSPFIFHGYLCVLSLSLRKLRGSAEKGFWAAENWVQQRWYWPAKSEIKPSACRGWLESACLVGVSLLELACGRPSGVNWGLLQNNQRWVRRVFLDCERTIQRGKSACFPSGLRMHALWFGSALEGCLNNALHLKLPSVQCQQCTKL